MVLGACTDGLIHGNVLEEDCKTATKGQLQQALAYWQDCMENESKYPDNVKLYKRFAGIVQRELAKRK